MEEHKKDSADPDLLSHRGEGQFRRSGTHESESSGTADAVQGLVHGQSTKRSQLMNKPFDFSLTNEFESRVRELTDELQSCSEQLRTLASEVTQAKMHARKHLALILHDDLQQLLFFTKLTLSSALMDAEKPEVRYSLKKIKDLLNQSIDKCRTLTGEISPPILSHDSLAGALRWLAIWINGKYGLTVDLKIDENIETLQDVRSLLFLAVRELLINILKHADVKQDAVCVVRSGSDDPSIASLMDAIRSCVHPELKIQ